MKSDTRLLDVIDAERARIAAELPTDIPVEQMAAEAEAHQTGPMDWTDEPTFVHLLAKSQAYFYRWADAVKPQN